MSDKSKECKGVTPVSNATSGICSSEVLLVLDAIKKTKEEEEARFDKRMDDAVDELEKRSNFKMGVICVAATTVIAILGYFATSGINCVVREKVNSEFERYTKQEIDARISGLAKELRERIADCTNAVDKLNCQSRLLQLHTLAVGGDPAAYDVIKMLAKNDEFARDCLASLDSYFSTFMNRMGHDSCMYEKNWGYRKVDIPEAEKIRLIKEDPGLSKENLNLLIGLIAEAKDPKSYAGLVVRKAAVCDNLFDRVALIDCICVWFDSCPRRPDLESLRKWWDANKRPEYDKFN